MPVPSGTPYIGAVMRRGDDVLPVFDLAGMLGVRIVGDAPLCLIAKRRDGPMAVQIDESIPTLHVIEPADILLASERRDGVTGAWVQSGEDVPVYSLSTLGLAEEPPVDQAVWMDT